MTRFAIVVGAFTVGIGFGLRDVVNNFVSGLIVLFEHPVKAGDPIQIGDVVGRARYIGIRATMIESTSGASAIIPNGKLISGKFTNWTLSRHIRQIFVPVIARADLSADEVTSLPLDVTKENEKVMDIPQPGALFVNRNVDTLECELRIWTRALDEWVAIHSDLIASVERAFRKIEKRTRRHNVRPQNQSHAIARTPERFARDNWKRGGARTKTNAWIG